MSRSVEITVPAEPDEDDCLAYAASAYIEEHPDLVGYDLSPRWTDDDRETVTLSVPSWHVEANGERHDEQAERARMRHYP